MLSKQKTKNLFNNQYNKSVDKKKEGIDGNSIKSSRVKITSIRIKNNKYFNIKLPHNNSLNKSRIKLNLNKIPRPNYTDGSQEMYRAVNGLCHYCGHNEYEGKITLSKKGYVLTDISCTKCNRKQPWEFIHIYNNKEQKDRGKDYADRKKIKNSKLRKQTKSQPKKVLIEKKVIDKVNRI